MTPSYAELGETCVATTVVLGIVVFFCATYATATFRTTHSDPCGAALRPVDTVMSILVRIGVAVIPNEPKSAYRKAICVLKLIAMPLRSESEIAALIETLLFGIISETRRFYGKAKGIS